MLKILKVITFLFSILGLVFACTPTPTEPKYDDNPKPSSIPVTVKITNAADYEDCDFYISGTLDDSYLAIPKTNGDTFNITVSKGNLFLYIQARKGDTVCGVGEVSISLTGKIELSVTLNSNFKKATVTFETNGGSVVEPKTVISGMEIGTLPVSTKDGFVLDNWYKDEALTEKVSSLYKVKEDITLYAKWISATTELTVTFESNGGSSVNAQTVKAGEKIETSPVTTKVGYVFSGWYSDSALIQAVSFPFPVTSNCTLYAKWTKENDIVYAESITLNRTSVDISKNDTITLNTSVSPANATNKTITWTSSNESVATVAGGVITGVAEGTANIIATVAGKDGKSITATCLVTVSALIIPVESVSIAKGNYTVEAGATLSAPLTVTVLPDNATNKSVIWSSSNESVATVDQNGNVKGVAAGTVTITATSHNAKSDSVNVTVTGSKCAMPKLMVDTTVVENNETCDATIKTSFSFERGNMLDIVHYTTDGSEPTTSSNTMSPFTISKAGTYTIKAFAVQGGTGASDIYTATVKVTDPIAGKTIVFVKADSAPKFWVWEPDGEKISEKMGFEWNNQDSMKTVEAGLMNDSTGWFMYDISSYASGKAISFILNQGGTVTTDKTGTFWYDGTNCYDADPTTVTYSEPVITINPKDGYKVKTTGTISISIKDGNSPLTSANATVGSKSFSLADFASGSVAVKVADLGVSNGSTINISVTASNSIGSSSERATVTVDDTAKVDKFTWDNALIYFVMTDRFYNGNSSNDTSYGRVKTDCKGKSIGTFHGGDIAGLTQKLDYLDDLGVNAIWVTAPYEQIHGWVGGGKNGDFAHYAYHGYYVLDYTAMDKNMGTVEEFRTFVNAAHEKGIRVVMDIVMNHTGYENLKDMEEYGYGALSGGSHSWLPSGGETFHDKPINKQGSGWDKFWGANWIRGDFNGYTSGGGDDLTKCLDYLPDFKTDSTSSEPAPAILKTKWSKETSGFEDWIIPAAKDLRKDLGLAPVVYIEKWLAAWVEEFGIDGFRCDTAKHVDKYRWKELKEVCKTALQTWRKSSRATGAAKEWDEDFWMTGECYPWNIGDGSYYGSGFDSMIDFTFNAGSGRTPGIGEWADRANKLNGSHDDGQNALAYVSSHDTSLYRAGDMKDLGTKFVLLPGQVQIFYGDETARPYGDGGSDSTQGTRSDFIWSAVDGDVNKHWKKVGKFRQGHPAVGGGKQTEIASNTYKRYYNGQAGEDTVVIYVGSSNSVSVSGAFTDGQQVRNAYTGETATVSGGKATFNTASNPVLVEIVE